MTTGKKAGFFGSLRDALIESTPDPEVPAQGSSAVRNTPVPQTPSFSTLPRAPVSTPAVADESSLKYLRNELSKALSPLYARFMAQYDGFLDVIPEEGMRFKAALKASQTTVEDITTAVDGMAGALTDAHDRFTATYEMNKKKATEAATAQVEATQKLIESRRQQLAAIESEIKSLQGKLQTDLEAIKVEETRIEGTRIGFEAAYAQISGELNAQRAHIAQQRK